MTIFDILKIVVPIIVALCGTVWATMRWTYERESKAQREYWKDAHDSLNKAITDHRSEHMSWKESFEEKLALLDKSFNEHRVIVAKDYMLREHWLDHAKGLERKVDQLRMDMSREMQAMTKEVAQLRGGA